MKKTKKERRRRGRSLPRSRAQSKAQKSREAGRRGGEGVRREEQRDERNAFVREMRLSVCLSVCEMRDILVKSLANGNNQKRAAARFHLWTSEVHK